MTTEHDGDTCISCGMPMRTPDEHAQSDPGKPYCVHCAGEDGQLKSYPEVLAGFTAFLQHTQGLSQEAARDTAAQVLAKQPAWSSR
jgi:hypothetical protein